MEEEFLRRTIPDLQAQLLTRLNFSINAINISKQDAKYLIKSMEQINTMYLALQDINLGNDYDIDLLKEIQKKINFF